MTLPIPERLAAAIADRYRITRALGAGGMATVYLADDLKHDRRVAIKVLKPELAAVLGADRFVVEIKTTAALQHPHILPLFDSGTADGFLFYVMPYIEGETIRDKLNRETQFGVDEAVRIAREVADALDYAHRHGVIHRDIKPENLLLHDGRAMVMDFGIALAVSAAAGGRMTETGLSLGTPHYMSPEQATAEKEITPRSDVYSLASVLYEMLSGQPPHVGGAAQQIIMKIIVEPVQPVTVLRKTVPPNVSDAVSKALEKLPADRFESAKAFGDALANQSFATGMTTGPAAARKSAGAKRALIAMGVVTAAALSIAAWALRPVPVEPPVVGRFGIELPDSVTLYTNAGTKLAFSRDGTQLLIVGQKAGAANAVYIRRLNDPIAVRVRGMDEVQNPSFSPDGQSLVFQQRGAIKIVPAVGGVPKQLTDSGNVPSWGDGGQIVYSNNRALWSISADGGAPRLIIKPDSTRHIVSLGWPDVLPGGEYALITYLSRINTIDSARLGVLSLREGTLTPLGVAGTNSHYVSSGHIVYGRAGGEVYAAPFSLRTRTVTGPPVLLLQDVWQGSGGATGFAVARNTGVMSYHIGSNTLQLAMVAVDQKGVERRLTNDVRNFVDPSVSPDGRHVAVSIRRGGRSPNTGAIWILDVTAGSLSPLTGDSGMVAPKWSRDGARVIWMHAAPDSDFVRARAWDASGPAEVLARGGPASLQEISVGSPGGVTVIRRGVSSNNLLMIAPLESLSALRPLLRGPLNSPAVSPNGHLLAYQSTETGRVEVIVTTIPAPGPLLPVSTSGGQEPVWSRDGTKLFFRSASGQIMAASITERPLLTVTRRDSLFRDVFERYAFHADYDVFPDGRFLFTRAADAAGQGKSAVFAITNWQQMLRK